MLTDYERLPQFIPNLAVCERLETPPGAPERLVRLRQVDFLAKLLKELLVKTGRTKRTSGACQHVMVKYVVE